MYINFKVFEENKLNIGDVELLTAIKLKATEFLISYFLDSDYNRLKELSFIKHIKASKKKDHPFISLRLSDKGNNLLNSLEEAEATEEDKKVCEWLKSHYKKIGKEIGNGAKTLRHIRDFRIKSGIEKNNLIKLCLAFLQDEDNMEYNHKLEYAFYKPATAFETKFDLEESRLYKYYIKREAYFKSIFEEY
jgi:hypothetical protein